jgi:hypothetical protein
MARQTTKTDAVEDAEVVVDADTGEITMNI